MSETSEPDHLPSPRPGVGLSADAIDAVFPFHLVCDDRLHVIAVGSGLARVEPEPLLQRPLEDTMLILRPKAVVDAASVRERSRSVFVLRSIATGILLRGQGVVDGGAGTGEPIRVVFCISPWFTSMDDLVPLGITLDDLAPHDPVGEFLTMIQLKEHALLEATTFADRLQARQSELRNALARLEAVVAATPDTTVRFNADGRIIDATRGRSLPAGLNADDLLGTGWSPDSAVQTLIERSVRSVLDGAPLSEIEYEVGKGTGSRQVEARFVPCGDHEVLGIVRDVTDRRRSERELVEAREAALAAATARAQFVANVGHELRTPLNGVVGGTELLLLDSLSEPLRARAELIRASATTLQRCIDDILEFSNLDGGQITKTHLPFAVRDVVRAALDSHREAATTKALPLGLHIHPDVPSVLVGDARRIGQILDNLLDNALRFTDEGQVEVHVHLSGPAPQATSLSADDVMLGIDVVDSGTGIPTGLVPKMFGAFVQGDTSDTRRHGGTGLGLTIVRQLATLLGGDIAVRQTPGGGTTVSVTVRCQTAAAGQAVEVAQDAPLSTIKLNGGNALVVDDDDIDRLLMSRMLEHLGYTVTAVPDGTSALGALRAGPATGTGEEFAFVVLDMQMPVVDGLETTRALRALPGAVGATPVIAVSVGGAGFEADRVIEAGVDVYLHKPIRLADLAATLARVLNVGAASHEDGSLR